MTIRKSDDLRSIYGFPKGRTKALMRLKLWAEESQIKREFFPTIGEMINDQLKQAGVAGLHQYLFKRYQTDL